MGPKKRILILEDDAAFRDTLEGICNEIGASHAVDDTKSALNLLAENQYQLLLLDWHLDRASTLYDAIEATHADVPRMILLTVPDLPSVVAAMKSGACDVLRPSESREALAKKISEGLAKYAPTPNHSSLSRFTETATEMALIQKTRLIQARRRFLKTFLKQISSEFNLKKSQTAKLLDVSPRTLHRHLHGT